MTKVEKRLLIGLFVIGAFVVVASAAIAGTMFVAGGRLPATVAQRAESSVTVPAGLTRVIESVESGNEKNETTESTATTPRLPLPLSAQSQAAASDLTRLYQQVEPGVVSIDVSMSVSSPFGGGQYSQQGTGSGIVYDSSHIITNNHVVSGADKVEVVFYDGQRRAGKVLATDKFSDLAVVQVDNMPASARPLPLLRNFSDLAPGQPVIAMGNPFGKANTMTSGIISALGRVIPSGTTQFSIPQAIQTDAAINPGNSGGPLMDLTGQVIGVNAQINTTNTSQSGVPGNSGVGFAIPASLVAKVIPALIEKGKYEWPYLGVTGMGEITLDVATANKLSDTRGAYITSVVAGGPSANKLQPATNIQAAQQVQPQSQGGIQIIPFGQQQQQQDVTPVGGDIVTAVDGQPVNSFDDLLTYVAVQTTPGQTIQLTVLRDGKQVTVPITLGVRPDSVDTTQQQIQQQP
jgi:serine protease Do